MTIPAYDERLFDSFEDKEKETAELQEGFKRKLSYVVKIESVSAIPGADFLELVSFEGLGWAAISKKGQLEVGDLAAYFETDSLLEDVEEFEFMRPRKFRVKQIKLRKTYSNGLVMPFSELTSYKIPKDLKVGDDLTELFNVKHYQKAREEKQVLDRKPKKWSLRGWIYFYVIQLIEYLIGPINGQASFPPYFPKTDESRLENVKGLVARKYEGQHANITLKLHGSSMGVYYYKGKFGVCSRNLELLTLNRAAAKWKMQLSLFIAKLFKVKIESNESNTYWKTARSFELIDKLAWYCEAHKCNLAIFLEMCGPSINGNMYNFDMIVPFLFSVWDIDKKRYFSPKEVSDFSKDTCITKVHTVVGDYKLTSDINYYLDYFKKNKPGYGSKFEEGLVVRDDTGKLSFKIINPEFKALEDDTLDIE